MRKQVVHIRKYRNNSPKLFEKEKKEITKVLKDFKGFEIEHIGSTAVPGLGGKNIIDIYLILPNFSLADGYIKTLSKINYIYNQKHSILGKRLFLSKGDPSKFHLHIVQKGTDEHLDVINFRDYLRTHPETAQEYYNLKKKWAKEARLDRLKYVGLKTEFTKSISGKK